MVEFRNSGSAHATLSSDVTDDLLAKTGRALSGLAQVRETFRVRASAATTEEERQQLSHRADQAATAAVSEQGLSVDQYSRVLAAADENPEIEERLVAAAQEALWSPERG
jgi:hypothetical protein